MKYVTNGYEPRKVFEFFEQFSKIPRGSKNEKAAAEYIENFAAERGLFCVCDSYNNVFIRKKASDGYENIPAVALQGHIDMVCEKNSDSEHDFKCDPLRLQVCDGYLSAIGTTLGGDDGIAVAMMLAILDNDEILHPTIECLFTSDEEMGMSGAENFDYTLITARRMINIDSEEEGSAVISCAGSERTSVCIKRNAIPAKNRFIAITLKGLFGGHSGTDIDSGRSNAIRLCGSLLSFLYDKEPFEIVSIDGGGLDNAIARECSVVVTVLDPDRIKQSISEWETQIRPMLSKEDKGFRVLVSKHKKEDYMLTYHDTREVISLLALSPCGVLSMSRSVPDLVESSSNIGSVRTVIEEETIRVETMNLYRSCNDALIDDIYRRFTLLGKLLHAEVNCSARTFGWAPKYNSFMQKLYLENTKKLFGKEGSLVAIHAGLECGFFSRKIPEMDIISIGPDIIDIHSPKERLNLASCERVFRLITAMLENK